MLRIRLSLIFPLGGARGGKKDRKVFLGEWAGRWGWEHWREAEGATTEHVSWARTQRNFEPSRTALVANFPAGRFAPVHATREQVVGEQDRRKREPKEKTEAIASGFLLCEHNNFEP